jgi:hypothetical protein
MQNSSLMHLMGRFRVIFVRKNWDLSYQHIYGHPLKLEGVWANIILGDFTGATPSASRCPRYFEDLHLFQIIPMNGELLTDGQR